MPMQPCAVLTNNVNSMWVSALGELVGGEEMVIVNATQMASDQ